MAGRLRVMLVDDNPAVRAGVAALLEDSPVAELVGACEAPEQAVGLAGTLKPDVILVDLLLESGDGFNLASTLRERDCGSLFVLFTAIDHRSELMSSALTRGFHGYLSKSAAASDLEDCLATVGSGGYWLDGPPEAVAI